jgi:DNA-binding LacI/PurR family transcriptional regulator
MAEINRMSPKPLYQQVKDMLEHQILTGELLQGEPIPSERELCEQYSVSATPVRRALQELVRDGLIRRRPGIGSFVSSEARSLDLLLLIIGFEEEAWRRHSYLFSELIGGIARVTWERNATFSVARVPIGYGDIKSYLYSVIREGTFDGILLRMGGDLEEDCLVPLLETGFPYVVIKRHLPNRMINCVINDDMQGAFAATEHLIKLGHDRIGLIAAEHIAIARDRCEGYFGALQAHGIEADPDLIYRCGDYMEETGRRAAKTFISLANQPTAIFAPGDIVAIGAYQVIQEAGLRIPEDFAIVGYDDIPPAATLSPPLTSVSTPYSEFGIQSASLLLDIITQKVQPPQRMIIEQSLVVRDSCGSRLRGEVPVPSRF